MKLNKKITFLLACATVIITEIILSRFHKIKEIDLKAFLETVTLVISIIGIFSESKKEKKRISSKKVLKRNYSLSISFESSIYGGLIGGIFSGTAVAFVYYLQLHYTSAVYLGIIPYCAIIGCVFGVFLWLGRKLFSEINSINILWANFFGCTIGCLFAGAFSGMIGMWLFGSNSLPFIDPGKIATGSITACIFLILGTLIYDYEGKPKYIFISLVDALFLSAIISMSAYLFTSSHYLVAFIENKIYSHSLNDLIIGGLVVGAINGLVFGFIIGFTVAFYGYWKFAEKQQKFSTITLSN